jgi:hypothetical protein
MDRTSQDSTPATIYNAATRSVVSGIGVLLGISSIDHGVLEMLQGNHSTLGNLIKAQGPGHTWTLWTHGSEPAFTLVHNFLFTGVLATLAGLLLVLWSFRYIDRRRGALIFFLLSVVSFLVGGGMAQLLIFTLNWAAATRIRATLGFWRWILPSPVRRILARLWRWPLVVGTVLFAIALEIALFGYFPGLPRDQDVVLRFLWDLAPAIIAAFLLSYLCAFARDIEAYM